MRSACQVSEPIHVRQTPHRLPACIRRAGRYLFALFLIGVGLPAGPAGAQAYQSLDLVLDAKSRFSMGCQSIPNLVEVARVRKVDGLAVTDQARVTLQFGFPPFERVFRKKVEAPSVLEKGAAVYLAEIRQVDEEVSEVLLLPGIEAAPFYYWTGSPFDESLVAHNWDKHLLLIGLQTAEELEQLPLLHSNLSTRFFDRFKGPFFGILAVLLVSIVLFYQKKYPKLSLTVALLSFLLAINYHPFRSSRYDPFHGDAGPGPYQDVINYANERGALVYWNHLESPTANRARTLAGIRLETGPHPEDLLSTVNYSGFQALDDAPVPATEPGGLWDQVLQAYQKEQRPHPVWGFGANDFHCEDQDGHRFGAVRTIVWVRNKDAASVLEALRQGRAYAVRQSGETGRLVLEDFQVVDGKSGLKATLGETLDLLDLPEIRLALAFRGRQAPSARYRLIRNGVVVKEETVSLPYQGTWRDLAADRREPAYYRLMVEAGKDDRLVSNPVFVRFKGTKDRARETGEAGPVAQMPHRPAAVSAPPSPEVQPPEPAVAPSAPTPGPVSTPTAPATPPPAAPRLEPPDASPPEPAAPISEQFATVRLKRLSLRSGPGSRFPKILEAVEGEPLELVRTTRVMLNGKPWVVVRKEGRLAYVWSGFLVLP